VRTRLDEILPVFQFHEAQAIRVNAERHRVGKAIHEVTAREIRFFRALTWIRRFGRPGPESILNAPADRPILEVATETTFVLLAEDLNREIVFGTAVIAPPGWRKAPKQTPEEFRSLSAPGFALAAMNFRIEDAVHGGCVLSTETRVRATDRSTRRRFAVYWRAIHPGSALIRRMWLRAIKRRAEARAG
jgi:hypothetical protein